MNDLPPDAIDFGEVLRSLFRGWRWIGATFALATLTTAAILFSMPVRYQSTLELRLAAAEQPLLATYGLHMGSGDVVSLLMGFETRQAAASLDTSPAVADTGGWTADQVTAVGSGADTIFVIVRDVDPELAAATANAVEEAARKVRSARLQQGLREVLLPLERDRGILLTGLDELTGKTDSSHPDEGSLDETLHNLRLENALDEVVALEGLIARIRRMMADPPRDWRVVEAASPGQHALRNGNAAKALVAVLVPTLLAAIAWLIHDGRPRHS